jgi:hypothetical protein
MSEGVYQHVVTSNDKDEFERYIRPKWRKPPSGKLKCNVYLHAFMDNKAEVGMCLWDH